MYISIFDLFKIGIGPSSSHTIGPMKAANMFVKELEENSDLTKANHIDITLYGSLAFTGKGHGTDKAIMVGLEGLDAKTIDHDSFANTVKTVLTTKTINLNNKHTIYFDAEKHIIFNIKELLPLHTNGMKFSVYDKNNDLICEKIYYSIGGGFVTSDNDTAAKSTEHKVPYPFNSAKELFAHCEKTGKTIAQIVFENETALYTEKEVHRKLEEIKATMLKSIEDGLHRTTILPGELKLSRRAHILSNQLTKKAYPKTYENINSISWASAFAFAVAEENADNGRVVCAPTCGSAGIMPAILRYIIDFVPNTTQETIETLLLTAGGIGTIYKSEASISGAEVGCQGEVGVACSMAAGALSAVLGGTNTQIEIAAEVSMEHHLGLTCDPIAGLVQIPCIERNAVATQKAITIAHMSLLEKKKNRISLDRVILTMKQTGLDMSSKYKETSQGGLAIDIVNC